MKIMSGNQFALTVYGFSMMLPATVNDGQITSLGVQIAVLSVVFPLVTFPAILAELPQILAEPFEGLLVISAFLSNVAFLTASMLHAMRSHKSALVASVLSVVTMVHCRIAAPTTESEIVAFGQVGPAYPVWLAAGLLMLCVTLRGYRLRE